MAIRFFCALLLFFLNPSAHACEQGTCVQHVIPADGALDVAVDSHIWVRYNQSGNVYPDAILRDESNEVVAVELRYRHWGLGLNYSGMLEILPQEALEPDAAYTLHVLPDESSLGADLCAFPDQTTFQTGSTEAIPPTQAPSTPTVHTELLLEEAPNGPCDAGAQRFRITVEVPDTEDAILYELRQGGTSVSQDLDLEMPKPEYTGYANNEGFTPPFMVMEQESTDGNLLPACFTVVGLNETGQAGPPSPEVCIGPEAQPGSGCGCFSGAANTSPYAVIGTIFLFSCRRRRLFCPKKVTHYSAIC